MRQNVPLVLGGDIPPRRAKSNATCRDCRAGHFSDLDGASTEAACKVCSKGRWSNEVAAPSEASCRMCDSGRYSPRTAQTSNSTCTMCKPETEWPSRRNSGHGLCTMRRRRVPTGSRVYLLSAMPPRHVLCEMNASKCTRCPIGFYQGQAQ